MNVMEVYEEAARERLRTENPEYRKWEAGAQRARTDA